MRGIGSHCGALVFIAGHWYSLLGIGIHCGVLVVTAGYCYSLARCQGRGPRASTLQHRKCHTWGGHTNIHLVDLGIFGFGGFVEFGDLGDFGICGIMGFGHVGDLEDFGIWVFW